jgi:hypothetical protein
MRSKLATLLAATAAALLVVLAVVASQSIAVHALEETQPVEIDIDPSNGAQQPVTAQGGAGAAQPPESGEDDDDDDDEDDEGDDEDYDGEGDDEKIEHPEYYYPYEDFPYYKEEFNPEERWPPFCNPEAGIVEECEDPKKFLLDEFTVGGKNIAEYSVPRPEAFELYEDFDISSYIKGNESWKELLFIRRSLQRPTLSWYVDKVARKRWLTAKGFPQPEIYYMKYKYELAKDADEKLTSPPQDMTDEDFKQVLIAEIEKNLPTNHSFAAKPTHMSMTMGSWLVDHTPIASVRNGRVVERIHTSFTRHALRLSSSDDHERFRWDSKACASSLAEGLFRKPATIESWALHNVHPGLVVEELLAFQEDPSLPPQEFCFFVIWGRVYVAQWNYVLPTGRHMYGFYYRSGRRAPDPLVNAPQFIDLESVPWWDTMVDVAEALSQHKDFFRVDFLIGVSKEDWKKFDRSHQLRHQLKARRHETGDDSIRVPPPPEHPPIKFIVSECEIFPTTMFTSPFIADEAARLWIGGYKVGNYTVVSNNEVPRDYVPEQKKIAEQWQRQKQDEQKQQPTTTAQS